ncbi:MAG: 50S ribosomal protein L17 [Clostridia bacterium]|nr:50S ribosomal protein L17 [Clostridia bacterium]
MPGKLGRTAQQREALLRNQASELLWYGKITTTKAKAKELQPYVEKIITKAIKVYDDNIEFDVKKTDAKGKEITVKNVKDSPKKLAVRRELMGKLRDLQEVKPFSEKKSDFKARTADIRHPLMEKLFNEIAPKYAQRAEELGQGGGYTRIYLLGERRGDAAEEAIIELV